SGDNSRKDYNEADDMRAALVEAGVPDSIIHCDYAGLRTLDSVVRMNEIFGQDSFIVVSQEFHNERAVFLAQNYGLTAYGYNAKDLSLNRSSYRTKIRELFARVKVFVDIATGKEPKYLGEKIKI
ncbi:ElyC/SanA/YdcF family protein, partial [Dysgonomonas sp.]